MSENEMDQILGEYEEEYPEIFSLNLDDQIEKLKLKIKIEEEHHSKQTELLKSIESSEVEYSKRTVQCNANIDRVDTEYAELLKGSLELAQNLEKIEASNFESYKSLQKLYVKKVEPPLLMHQMPIFHIKSNSAEFISLVEQYLEKEPLLSQNPNSSTVGLESDLTQLQVAKDNWLQTQRKLLEIEQTLVSFKSGSDVLHAFYPRTVSELQCHINELEMGENQDEETIENLELDILEQLKRNLAIDVDIWLEPHIRHSNDMAKRRLNLLKELIQNVVNFTDTIQLIWICIELDKKRIREPLTCLDIQAAQANQLRIQWMQVLISQEPNQLEVMRQRYLSALCSLLDTENNRYSINELLDMYKDFEGKLKNKVSALTAPHTQYKTMLSSLREAEAKIHRFVYDGPVLRPQFEDSSLRVRIQQLLSANDVIKDGLKRLNLDYQNFLKELHDDEYKKNQYKLWSWFLTDPQKMVDAIQKLKESLNMGMSSTKIISGIRRQLS